MIHLIFEPNIRTQEPAGNQNFRLRKYGIFPRFNSYLCPSCMRGILVGTGVVQEN